MVGCWKHFFFVLKKGFYEQACNLAAPQGARGWTIGLVVGSQARLLMLGCLKNKERAEKKLIFLIAWNQLVGFYITPAAFFSFSLWGWLLAPWIIFQVRQFIQPPGQKIPKTANLWPGQLTMLNSLFFF